VSDLRYDTVDGEMFVDPILVSDTMNMDALEGILFYGFSNYRVLPRNNDDFVGINVALDSTALVKSTVGLPALEAASLLAYPNPTADLLQFDGPAGTWVLRDLQGRLIMQGRRDRGPSQVDLSPLASGAYLLTMDSGGLRTTYRVVKQ
jgi:hypothetical protein